MNVHFGNNFPDKNSILAHKTLDIKTIQFDSKHKPLHHVFHQELMLANEPAEASLLIGFEPEARKLHDPNISEKNDIKTEPEKKRKQHTAKVQAVETPKTDAGKMQDLDASERPESAATPKRI